ncbi:tagatose 6-phosphate kinase [Cytobacillus oceanisediminis]|jgi:tagatose 6-phosphate kinase|uniref:Tagatose-6-phosphate kinase n=1 Tax=Cytobacillus oceanisediminis TaxID=665099 RepID=A0A2V2ZWU2_9BACI|nr:1-phosphofructokinase [Cytobacillus oceanisediminis]PWW26950.1 tagatose 6-phosphate kinase [Cytobacillus oceanisediminis]
MEKPSILTVTLNPAIDSAYRLERLKIGGSTRTKSPLKSAGGKGLNVTRVLGILGEKVTATGFLGGSNGTYIRNELAKLDVRDEFVQILGETRQCLAFIDSRNNQTEILEEGPFISSEEQEEIRKRLRVLIPEVKILVVSGSLPLGVSSSLYQWMIREAKNHGVKVLLDTSGEALAESLLLGPYLIKPNREELEEILGRSCQGEEEIWKAMEKIAEKGIEVVIVSAGDKGSLVYYKGERLKVASAEIRAVSAVGSGDSFIAGFAAGLSKGYSIKDTLVLASACGAANVLEERTGYINLQNLDYLIKQISIESSWSGWS